MVGRKAELASLEDASPHGRVISLVGPAGVGKTRLAVELAATLVRRTGVEVQLVELGHGDRSSVGQRRDRHRVAAPPVRHGDALRSVAARLHGRPVLLLLDNCEQLRTAVAMAVEHLLAACPQLAVLVTSRIPLWVDGEEVVRLEPLRLDAAIELFWARCDVGSTDDASDDAVAAICRAVDGLPLAVELAAGLTRSLTVDQVAERIGDRFHLLTVGRPTAIPHHQTLRSALEWSHDLLDEDDRVLARRLAVFAGGWTLDSAEAVCADGKLDRGSIAPALARLVDASMVTFADVDGVRRFGMLDTLRHFAAEQLDLAGERDAVRAAHLDWCLTVAEHAADEDGSDAAELDREFANVRGALDTTPHPRLTSRAADLLLGVQRSWLMHGHLDDARRLLLQYAADPSLPDALRAQLYGHAGNLSIHAGRLPRLRGGVDLGLPFTRRCRDDFVLAENRYFLGIVDVQHARVEPARDAFTEVLAIMRRMDRQTGISAALDCLADVADLRGDHATAVRHRDAAEAVDRAIGDNERLATGLARRAIGAINAGAMDEARVRGRRGSPDRRCRRQLVAHGVGQRGRGPSGDGDGRHRRRLCRARSGARVVRGHRDRSRPVCRPPRPGGRRAERRRDRSRGRRAAPRLAGAGRGRCGQVRRRRPRPGRRDHRPGRRCCSCADRRGGRHLPSDERGRRVGVRPTAVRGVGAGRPGSTRRAVGAHLVVDSARHGRRRARRRHRGGDGCARAGTGVRLSIRAQMGSVSNGKAMVGMPAICRPSGWETVAVNAT